MNKFRFLLVASIAAIIAMGLLSISISGKNAERDVINTNPVVKADGVEARNEVWRQHYPRQYDSWRKTSENDKITDMLKASPQLAILWAGYGFAKDYNAPRGHFYALQSNQNTLRTGAPVDKKTGPMPTPCWTCKSPDVPRIIERDGENEYFTGKWAKYGDEIVNSIGCGDCHDSKTANLTISRPHLKRALEYNGVKLSEVTHQDMRSLVCAQCHSEYYFKKTKWTDKNGNEKTAAVVTFPWEGDMTAEEMESYYNERFFVDWTHKISKTPMLKAQHPGYEIYKTGIHARRNVACADCHMPYKQEGAIKFSDHHIQSPLENIANTCLTCHRESEEELKNVVDRKRERKDQLNDIAMDNIAKAHLEAGKALELGATKGDMAPIQDTIRSAQWIWDYSIASHGSFYHAPEETLRLLSVANEKAQQARLKLVRVLAKYGAIGYVAPDFSTKAKAQKLAGVPLAKLAADKMKFKRTLLKAWTEAAIAANKLDPSIREGMSDNTAYPQN